MAAERPVTTFRGVAPVLPVADVAIAAAYYRDKLGFVIRPAVSGSDEYWVLAERGPVEIHLVTKNEAGGLCILVDSADQAAEELKGRGATFESGPTNQEYNMRDFAVSDPDGHEIVFWQPLLPASGPSPEPQKEDEGAYDEDRPF